MRVIGTAGHVDHGKSALIRALTGINPDRLREEQERQMTIDLGFAWMTLPDGEEIGFIDVPGHRDFIDNMLAGVGGIDAALFVIAADEGVMPQTKEHLAILDLLEIKQSIIVLTKIDMIEDHQWLDLVIEDIRNLFEGTRFSNAKIVEVSALTGEGIDELRAEIGEIARSSIPRSDLKRPRLSIDRSFSISGFGTVVTGTLIDGTLSIGQEVEILPKKLKARIRGLQTHKTKVETVIPGSRAAINLSGVDVASLERGDVVVLPGQFSSTKLIDVHYKHLNNIGNPLKHDQQVKVFIGAAQKVARVRILGEERIQPGQEGWLQLVFQEPMVTAKGDHYILRRPSPGATLGGGLVIDPHPKRKYRRKDQEVLNRLEQMLLGTPGEILAQTLLLHGPMKITDAGETAGLSEKDLEIAIEELKTKGEVSTLGNEQSGGGLFIIHSNVKEQITRQILSILNQYHETYPLRFGISREELKSRAKINGAIFTQIIKDLVDQGAIIENSSKVAISEHQPQLNQDQKKDADELLYRFDQSPFSTPSVKECVTLVGEEVFAYLLESRILVQLSSDVILRTSDFEIMQKRIQERLKDGNGISIAEVRDLFGTSRKYALALMEYLDSIGMTVRQGDIRKLVR